MATYLVTVKAPDGLNLGDLAAEVAEVLYHVPATVTAAPLDRAEILRVLRETADDPHEVENLADAVVAYLEADPPPVSDWVALTPDRNTLPPMTTER